MSDASDLIDWMSTHVSPAFGIVCAILVFILIICSFCCGKEFWRFLQRNCCKPPKSSDSPTVAPRKPEEELKISEISEKEARRAFDILGQKFEKVEIISNAEQILKEMTEQLKIGTGSKDMIIRKKNFVQKNSG